MLILMHRNGCNNAVCQIAQLPTKGNPVVSSDIAVPASPLAANTANVSVQVAQPPATVPTFCGSCGLPLVASDFQVAFIVNSTEVWT